MSHSQTIDSPLDAGMEQLSRELAGGANLLESGAGDSLKLQLHRCRAAGVFRWFVARSHGGQGWSSSDLLRAYVELGAACLTTTFVITQFTGASRRLATGENHDLAAAWLPDLAAGARFATVGISHLTASRTGPVHFRDVWVPEERVVSGPVAHVMRQGGGAGTGGLQTSALALGLSKAAIGFVAREALQRDGLQAPGAQLQAELERLESELYRLAGGSDGSDAEPRLRVQANSLVLRATQAALVAAKGAGFVHGHAAGRWCREALFFLVWSCPEPVATANLCEFAGLR